jgi:hypothetical protein
MMRFSFWRFLVLLVALAMFPTAQAAEPGGALLTATFRDWFVYRAGEGDELNCFALSKLRSSDPGNIERGENAFLISTWPGRNNQHEPSIVPGYPYREGEDSAVRVRIGGDQFEFGLIRNDGDKGGAWMEEDAQEGRLVTAMKAGATMVVTGTAADGTLTRDTYSLAGITLALENIESNCN